MAEHQYSINSKPLMKRLLDGEHVQLFDPRDLPVGDELWVAEPFLSDRRPTTSFERSSAQWLLREGAEEDDRDNSGAVDVLQRRSARWMVEADRMPRSLSRLQLVILEKSPMAGSAHTGWKYMVERVESSAGHLSTGTAASQQRQLLLRAEEGVTSCAGCPFAHNLIGMKRHERRAVQKKPAAEARCYCPTASSDAYKADVQAFASAGTRPEWCPLQDHPAATNPTSSPAGAWRGPLTQPTSAV